jgi:ADP-ribose pyrophosphatase
MKKHKTLSTKTIHQSYNFRLDTEEVELFGGQIVTRDRVIHNGASIMIPLQSDGKLILVKQYRHSVREDLIEFPAGTVDSGEAPLECAKRELMEETGWEASNWVDLGTLYPCPGFCSEIQYLFLASDLREAPQNRDEDELIEILPLSIEQVVDLIKQNKIKDGKTIAAFYRALTCGYLKF